MNPLLPVGMDIERLAEKRRADRLHAAITILLALLEDSIARIDNRGTAEERELMAQVRAIYVARGSLGVPR